MRPSIRTVAVASLLFAWAPTVGRALAGDAPPAAPAAPPAAPMDGKTLPPVASSADAKAAIARFREGFKARDVASKADAVDGLGKVNHPDVIAELVKLVRHREEEIRSAAFQNLAAQRALPALVGTPLAATVDVKSTDWQYVTDVIDTVKAVEWRGALPTLVKLLRHDDHSVVRWSLDAIGDLKDVRGLDAILGLMKELKLDQAVKWEGGEVHVDTGASGDADQRAAEAAYAAKYGSGHAKGKGSSRTQRSLGDIIFLVLKDLTGQTFHSGKAAREWIEAHADELAVRRKALDDQQKAQDEAAKTAVAAARAGR